MQVVGGSDPHTQTNQVSELQWATRRGRPRFSGGSPAPAVEMVREASDQALSGLVGTLDSQCGRSRYRATALSG